MTDLNFHLLLAVIAGASFLLLPLIIGRFVRPKLPTPEKDAVYECGEPTIGTSYIQFDLRFYVVALLFIIFDVEVLFFFPWGTVFGGATQLADPALSAPARTELSDRLVNMPAGTLVDTTVTPEAAHQLALTGLVDVLVFFGVLLVGFAYVWKRGDIDWVRAMVARAKTAAVRPRERPVVEQREPHTVA